jgi:hypothetical protein
MLVQEAVAIRQSSSERSRRQSDTWSSSWGLRQEYAAVRATLADIWKRHPFRLGQLETAVQSACRFSIDPCNVPAQCEASIGERRLNGLGLVAEAFKGALRGTLQ